MELLTENAIRQVTNYINKQCYTTSEGCIIQKKPTRCMARVGDKGKLSYGVHQVLFALKMNMPLAEVGRLYRCEINKTCFNPDHQRQAKNSSKNGSFEVKSRIYQKHTPECEGIDWVVVDRIVTAGTIEALPRDHVICDCERAYIVKYVQAGERMLRVSGRVAKKLAELDV